VVIGRALRRFLAIAKGEKRNVATVSAVDRAEPSCDISVLLRRGEARRARSKVHRYSIRGDFKLGGNIPFVKIADRVELTIDLKAARVGTTSA
jgi:hypothetical protein